MSTIDRPRRPRLLGPVRQPEPERVRVVVVEPPSPAEVRTEVLHREIERRAEKKAAEAPLTFREKSHAWLTGERPRLTREQRRSRRHREVRARTISVKRMTKRELEIGRLLYPEDTRALRPHTRAECVDAERPCPFVSCQHHLYLDVSPRTGAIKLNFPDLEPDELRESCALDVADREGTTLEDVGAVANLTRERVRQVEVKALAKLEALATSGDKRAAALLEHAGIDERRAVRRLPVLQEDLDEDAAEDEREGRTLEREFLDGDTARENAGEDLDEGDAA